ncbi:hypothetical protein DPMN_106923 [Dreissena polymorpha]|uniref:Uncharacterized protein n=1 Tax=Dreissena polymorpha TaxID=45954 RepID=A0A9D4QJD6_DREPO|nr:hypothetical protein DPMN_106923 [Dreissena polymorpha]
MINRAFQTSRLHEAATERDLTNRKCLPKSSKGYLLTKFHEDRTVNVASIVKNAPPLESHVFQANIFIFEFIQDIIKTNLLTKFHEDWTINVASRVLTRKNAPPLFHDDRKINVTSRELTRQMLTPHNRRRTKGDHKSSP